MAETVVYNEDCMVGMKGYPDKYFDLAIVDPPYGINVAKMAYTQEGNRPVKQKNGSVLRVKKLKYKHGDWDNNPPKQEYFTELFRVSKHQIIWGVNYMPILLIGGRIVWNKLNGDNSFSDAEIAYCSLHGRVRLFNFMWSGMCQGKSAVNGDIQQGNKKLNEKRIHPTQKPIELYRWLLKNYAKPGDKILDTHVGSGSSRIACDKAGLDFVGYEIDRDYWLAQEERFRIYKQQLKLF